MDSVEKPKNSWKIEKSALFNKFLKMCFQSNFSSIAGVSKVVDLCAAPGSWSQVLSANLRYIPSPTLNAQHEILS